MPGSAFVDTNVLVYAVDDGEPRKRDRARSLLAAPSAGALVVSTQVLNEFYVVTTRKLERPLPEARAAEAVKQLSMLPTVVTDVALVHSAITISRESRLSLWDALIVAAATAAGCERILTEDLSDGASIGSVKIENPFL
jgi:predicted nucleic acid-binding protein